MSPDRFEIDLDGVALQADAHVVLGYGWSGFDAGAEDECEVVGVFAGSDTDIAALLTDRQIERIADAVIEQVRGQRTERRADLAIERAELEAA